MKKALVILAPGFEEIEAITTIDVLRRGGMRVTTAGTVPGPLTAAHETRHLPDAELETVQAQTFDVVILPGGNEGTANLKRDARVKSLLQRQKEAGRWIAAICAAPSILAEHHLLAPGQKVTCYPSVQPSISAEHLQGDRRVVVSGQLITSMGPGTAVDFGLMILEKLVSADKAQEVRQGLCAAPAEAAAACC